MSGHEAGDCSRQSEQQHERRGSAKDKLDRVTDKTLAEAERKALHGLCGCAVEASWQDLEDCRGVKLYR